MSHRRVSILEEVEILRREIDRLRIEKSKDMEKMRYLEQERAARTRARIKEIKNFIQRAQELDVAFLVDATSSMQRTIEMVKDEIVTMAAGISSSYPQCKLRFALVTYRDYDDDPSYNYLRCDFTENYYGPRNAFRRALSRVKCVGGGDVAEDVFTGLETVAELDWRATNRLLVHIGDAPCHGMQFYEGNVCDAYPEGDKYGRNIRTILRVLRETCEINLYCFCHLNHSTLKMVKEFRKAAGHNDWVEEWHFNDADRLPENVIAVSCSTIAKSLRVLPTGGTLHGKFVKEQVVEKVPAWDSLPLQWGVEYVQKKCSSVKQLCLTILNARPLELIRAGDVLVQIAPHPFRGDGAVRWPYYARNHGSGYAQPAREVVVKRFKTPFGKSPTAVHAKECYVNQMEVQSVARQLAEEFNKCTAHLQGVMKIWFTEVSLLEVRDKFYTMETLLSGEWIRFSNNADYVNKTSYAATLQAFTHWTYEVSQGVLMVTDLQGVKLPDAEVPGKHVFWLCDPAIHTRDENVLRFTGTNLGEHGYELFFSNHQCNSVCRHLGLPASIGGHTNEGTVVGYALSAW